MTARFEAVLEWAGEDRPECLAVCEMAVLSEPLSVLLNISPQDGSTPMTLVFTPGSGRAPALKMQTVMACGKLARLAKEFPGVAEEADAWHDGHAGFGELAKRVA